MAWALLLLRLPEGNCLLQGSSVVYLLWKISRLCDWGEGGSVPAPAAAALLSETSVLSVPVGSLNTVYLLQPGEPSSRAQTIRQNSSYLFFAVAAWDSVAL